MSALILGSLEQTISVAWPNIVSLGTAVVAITGWLKSIQELKLLRQQTRENARKSSSESRIHIPTTEDILRYTRNSRILGLFLVVGVAASLVSSAVVLPKLAAQAATREQIDKDLERLRKENLELQQRIKALERRNRVAPNSPASGSKNPYNPPTSNPSVNTEVSKAIEDGASSQGGVAGMLSMQVQIKQRQIDPVLRDLVQMVAEDDEAPILSMDRSIIAENVGILSAQLAETTVQSKHLLETHGNGGLTVQHLRLCPLCNNLTAKLFNRTQIPFPKLQAPRYYFNSGSFYASDKEAKLHLVQPGRFVRLLPGFVFLDSAGQYSVETDEQKIRVMPYLR